MAESGDLDFRSCSQIGIFSNTILCGFLKNMEPDKWGAFSKHNFLLVFEKWDPAFFQKSQIFKISSSSHSKNAHIKLIGFQWVFGGWGDAPFIFFMGWMGQKSKNGPSRAPHPPVRAVYPPGVGLLVPWAQGMTSRDSRTQLQETTTAVRHAAVLRAK